MPKQGYQNPLKLKHTCGSSLAAYLTLQGEKYNNANDHRLGSLTRISDTLTGVKKGAITQSNYKARWVPTQNTKHDGFLLDTLGSYPNYINIDIDIFKAYQKGVI